jgi:hypothetical protein
LHSAIDDKNINSQPVRQSKTADACFPIKMITWLLALSGIFAVLAYVLKAKRPKEIVSESLSSMSASNHPSLSDEPH